MRRGEVLGLQWGDLDWHHANIHVRRSLVWYTARDREALADNPRQRWRFTTPKSERSFRTIVMSPHLRDALERHRLTSPVSPHDLVFCTPEGRPLDPNNLVKRVFLPTLARAGLRRIRFHDLRHTYTSLLIAQGAHVKFIQSQLGHASIQTTLDRYGHLLPETRRDVGARLDQLVFGADPHANMVLTEPAETRYNTGYHQQDAQPPPMAVTLTQVNH